MSHCNFTFKFCMSGSWWVSGKKTHHPNFLKLVLHSAVLISHVFKVIFLPVMHLHVCVRMRIGLFLPLSRWLRMCSRMETKLTNSGDESSIVSKQERSSRVFTENLNMEKGAHTDIRISYWTCSINGNFTKFMHRERSKEDVTGVYSYLNL